MQSAPCCNVGVRGRGGGSDADFGAVPELFRYPILTNCFCVSWIVLLSSQEVVIGEISASMNI
jgi:hypothetical protein